MIIVLAIIRRLRSNICGYLIAAGLFTATACAAPATAGNANPGPAASPKATPKSEVWIAVRKDGLPGSGTRNDPYNGSTKAKFDAILKTIPPHTAIHLGAGTFVTNGSTQMKDGWRINGVSKDKTTVKLADNVLTASVKNAFVIQHRDVGGFLNYFELSDLTVDCNKAHQPAYLRKLYGHSLNAWSIAAKSARIRNVKAIGTWAKPGEGFPCALIHGGGGSDTDSVQISGCDNVSPEGYLTAISVFDQTGGLVGGFIENCSVTDHPRGVGFGSGGWRNFEIRKNYTNNVSTPIVIDTHDYYNVSIWGNRFYSSSNHTLIFNGSGVYQGINVYDNVFDQSAGGPALMTNNATVSTQIYRNHILMNDAPFAAFLFSPKTSGAIHDNVIQENHVRSDLSGCPLLKVTNNRDSSGKPVTLGK
jgi:hypothetical protein